MKVKSESEVAQLCPTLSDSRTAAHQASPSMGFSMHCVLNMRDGVCWLLLFVQFISVQSLSRVRLFATPYTATYQALLSMGFSRQEYWSGVPLPSLIALIL